MAFFSQDDTTLSDPSASFWRKSDDDNQDFSFGGADGGEVDAFGGGNEIPVDFGSPGPVSPSGGHFAMSPPAQENGDASPVHQGQRDQSPSLDVSENDSGFGNQAFDFENPSSPGFDNQNAKEPEFSFDVSPKAAFRNSQEHEEEARGENAGHQMEEKNSWVASDTEAGFDDIRQPTDTCESTLEESAVDTSSLHEKRETVYVESRRQFLQPEERPQKPPNKPGDSRNYAELSLPRAAVPKKHPKAEMATKPKTANVIEFGKSFRNEHRKYNVPAENVSSPQGFLEEKSRKRPSDDRLKDDLLDFLPRHLDSMNAKPKASSDDILETSNCKPSKAPRSRSFNSAGDLNCRQMKPQSNPFPRKERSSFECSLERTPKRQPVGSQTPMRKQSTVNLGLNQPSSDMYGKTVSRPPTPSTGHSAPSRPSSPGGQPRGKTAQKSAVSEASGESESMTPAVFLQNMGPQLRDILKSEFLRAQQSRDRQEKIENDLRQLLAIAVKYRDLLAKRKADLVTQLDQVLQRLKNP